MFDFNFFGHRKYNTRVPETPLWSVPINTPETDMSDSGYTVGVDNNNQTVLKVSCNGSTITLTMNRHSTQQLIRLLEATLQEQDDEDTQHNDAADPNGSK
jgi:hypothetical protein